MSSVKIFLSPRWTYESEKKKKTLYCFPTGKSAAYNDVLGKIRLAAGVKQATLHVRRQSTLELHTYTTYFLIGLT